MKGTPLPYPSLGRENFQFVITTKSFRVFKLGEENDTFKLPLEKSENLITEPPNFLVTGELFPDMVSNSFLPNSSVLGLKDRIIYFLSCKNNFKYLCICERICQPVKPVGLVTVVNSTSLYPCT